LENVLAIIGEYNPFHNGHLYHLKESIKKTNAKYKILVLSGNFTQRGVPSLIDKWKKTEMALKNGFDLVIELPCLYSISSAEYFAKGAISLLNSLKVVNYVSFGSECGNLDILNHFASILVNEPVEYKALLKHELSKGLSFPKARENALMLYINDIRHYSNILNLPNNTLAIEYLKALKLTNSNIQPLTIQRKQTNHNSLNIVHSFASGSAIRKLIMSNSFDKLFDVIPKSSYEILINALRNGEYVYGLKSFEKEILYKIRCMSPEEISKVPDVSEGLENSIKNSAMNCNTIEELIENIKSKRFTQTRIQRILLCILLGYTNEHLDILLNGVPYVRMLGANNYGKLLMSSISSANKKLKIVTSIKPYLDDIAKNKKLTNLLYTDILSTDIYTLGYLRNSQAGLDYTKKFITA
jgi:predicted nucleotidyltransferase